MQDSLTNYTSPWLIIFYSLVQVDFVINYTSTHYHLLIPVGLSDKWPVYITWHFYQFMNEFDYFED